MTFPDWQQLSPATAAREVHQRVRERLSPAQQRAVFAHLSTESELEHLFAAAPRGQALSGVPYVLKDLFPVAGQSMLAGSTFLPEVRPPAARDAAIVEKLRAAGAVLVGRTHLTEFAYGITGENPHYGDCEHPLFPGHVTGGSSSGSAAAVAAGIVPFAIGSDTGGSVRLPAAFCGLFGFRLTPQDPFIADAFPLAPSYDTAGWFTSTAPDMATVIQSLGSLPTAPRAPRGCYVELPGLDAEVADTCAKAAARIASRDKESRGAVLAALDQSVNTYNTIVADEAWAVHRDWSERFRNRYDPAIWERINRVHTVTEERRVAARQRSAAIKRMWGEYFRSYDFLLLPASPFAALTKSGCTPENRLRILTLTALASIGGCPVLTLPVALPSGMTTGLQVVVPSADSPAISWVLKKATAK